MAHQTIQRIVRIIRKKNLLRPGDTVITGFSGGIDSTALLHILKTCGLGLRLVAVYIDHGLRPEETGAELLFTKRFADSLGIEYHSRKIPVREFRQHEGSSLEEAARILRYRALEDIRSTCHAQAIAVAHTADDQVEEFLLRMIRGSGLKGLSGMEYRREHVVRPLLAESKQSLVEYLTEHRIPFCHDSSNDDTAFLRNRIRHGLLPELEAHYNPAIRATILQTTAILSQEEDLLETMAADLFTSLCTITPGFRAGDAPRAITCPRQRFSTVHPALQRRVLEKLCWRMRSRPSFRKLLQLQQLITDGAAGAKQHLSHGLRVRLEAEEAHFCHPEGIRQWRGDGPRPDFSPRQITAAGIYAFPEINRQLIVQQQSPPLDLEAVPPQTLVVDGDRAAFPLVVRPPRPGEKMRPLGAPGSKKISRIYNDLKVSADLRFHHPLVTADERPVAILGLKIADDFKIEEESTSVLLLSWKPLTMAE